MLKTLKNWLAKESFYKKRCQEGLKEMDEILKNIERNHTEIQHLKNRTEETRKRINLAINKFED